MEQRIVIVGGGLAGVRAAEGAREAVFEGSVSIVAAEHVAPYERPRLSKGSARRRRAGIGDAVIHDVEWFRDNDIEPRTDTRVALIDAE